MEAPNQEMNQSFLTPQRVESDTENMTCTHRLYHILFLNFVVYPVPNKMTCAQTS